MAQMNREVSTVTEAIGMIETYGLIGSIEADAMLKRQCPISETGASRRWYRNHYCRGRCWCSTGAVDAGKAATRTSKLLSAHVIPRATNEVFTAIIDETQPIKVTEAAKNKHSPEASTNKTCRG